MITSSMTGNLGNHMWIYAITRSVAEHNGYTWGFNPMPSFDYYNGKPQMNFMDIQYGIQHNYGYWENPMFVENEWTEKYLTIDYANGDKVDFHPYQPEIYAIKDDTRLYIRCCQDARYLNRNQAKKYFPINPQNKEIFEDKLHDNDVVLDENTCVLNVRGGEYKNIPNVLLEKKYWDMAIEKMLERNSEMKFVVITDDVSYVYNYLYQEYPIYHFGIGCDYYVVNNAKNLILSNSSFALFPAWLNENDPFVIAPKYWARYNVSNGYWASSCIWTFPFYFIDRNGDMQKYA